MKTTCLPDSTRYDVQRGLEQLDRFTNSKHPNFWRSDESYFRAYRGDLDAASGEVSGAAPKTPIA